MNNRTVSEFRLIACMLIVLSICISASAVTSKVVRHSSFSELAQGRIDDVVVSSIGTVELGLASEQLAGEFEGVWSINCILVSGDVIWFGTSPNGGIYRYSQGELEKVYPVESDDSSHADKVSADDDSDEAFGDDNDEHAEQQDNDEHAEQQDEDSDEHQDGNNGDEDSDPGQTLESVDVNDPSLAEAHAVVDANDKPAEKEDEKVAEGEKADEKIINEHIFAMALDGSGMIIAGISGDECKFIRFDRNLRGEKVSLCEGEIAGENDNDDAGHKQGDDDDEDEEQDYDEDHNGDDYDIADAEEQIEVLKAFEPNEAKYIFSIIKGADGNLYAGTGPEGRIYKIDGSGEVAEVYKAKDKNILSLAAGEDGMIYAGSDERGLVYRIDTSDNKASVLYDSDQPEVTAILLGDDGSIYSTGTSAKIMQAQEKFLSKKGTSGRPDTQAGKKDKRLKSEGSVSLKIAGTSEKRIEGKSLKGRPGPSALPKPSKASFLYKVNKDGFVTNVFMEGAVFLCLAGDAEHILLGTGNNGQLYSVKPDEQDEAIVYEDEQASQISAVVVIGDDIIIGTANPAKLIKLGSEYALEGVYYSGLIDAGQPSLWGKLQIEADIPEKAEVYMSCRSSNVGDVNDPTFSEWTEPVKVVGPVKLDCPLGRFCQYKLILKTVEGAESPVIREVAVANTVPNVAPKVQQVKIERIEGKKGALGISYKAGDENQDTLVYKLEFRRVDRSGWIKLDDDLEEDKYEWDSRTVEDGRYELRVIASDERSNTSVTKLTGSRISEVVIVDNTPPVVRRYSLSKNECNVTLNLVLEDALSSIGKVQYTLDSNEDWKGALPVDMVYDTMVEEFVIKLKDVKAGEHVLAIRYSDDADNGAYKTFDVKIVGE